MFVKMLKDGSVGDDINGGVIQAKKSQGLEVSERVGLILLEGGAAELAEDHGQDVVDVDDELAEDDLSEKGMGGFGALVNLLRSPVDNSDDESEPSALE